MKIRKLTLSFFASSLFLAALGLLFVFEASVSESFQAFGQPYHFVSLQFIRFLIGLFGLIIVWNIPLKIWQKISLIFFIISLILMSLTFVPGIGLELNGAKRWLKLGPILFQPVEILKLSLIAYYANWLSSHQRFLPFLFLTSIPTAILLLQPDFGSLLLISSIALGVYLLSGAKLKELMLIILGGGLGLTIAVFSSQYRMRRILTFLNPELDPLGASFHIRQITLALGRGALFGQGIGRSAQKFAYIPEASTDSIFAIVGEELGFLGSSVIIALFCLFLFLGFKIISQKKQREFAFLFGAGIMVWFASQILLNLAAVVALVPLTGLPLPFFSYGGSSLIMILVSIGIILRISKAKP